MILRDPVHGLVSFEGAAERVVMALLSTRELQRLRGVRQLGLTSLVFPGAEHSRFQHAVGAAHVMNRLKERIVARQSELPTAERLDAEASDESLAAALLHDLGHGPFSHLFEDVLAGAPHHEDWTREALESPDTEVHRALERHSRGMARRVADLLRGRYRIGYLARAVSGTLDVDRCDYVLRDSHMTGVRYGLYDLDWLLRAFSFAELCDPAKSWVLAIEGRKGLPPVEGFFLGRHFMYRQVYHHKATRAAECMIRSVFARLAELVREGSLVETVPAALRIMALGERASLVDYLKLDDAALLACLASWETARDPVLSDLTRRLRARALFKTVPLPSEPQEQAIREEALGRGREVARAHGLRPDLYVQLDETSDVPYAEPTDPSPTAVWITLRHQPVRKLGDASFVLGEMRNKRVFTARLVFPEEIRSDMVLALEGLLE